MRTLDYFAFAILAIFCLSCTVVGFDTPYNKGVNAYRAKKYPEAAENFKIAIQKDAKFYEAWYNLALTYERLNKPEKAEECYKKAVVTSDDNARVLISYAMFVYEMGENSLTFSLLKRAINSEDDRAYPILALGYYYQLEQQMEKALVQFQKAKEIEPDYAMTYYRLGMYYKEQNNLDKARKNLQQAVILDSQDAASLEQYAWVLLELGMTTNSIQAFEGLIILEDDNFDAYIQLAKLYQTIKRHEQAVEVLWEARIVEPDKPEISKLLIISYKALASQELFDLSMNQSSEPKTNPMSEPLPDVNKEITPDNKAIAK